jgi:hypothetical protein
MGVQEAGFKARFVVVVQLIANALRQAQGERGWLRTPFDKLRANGAGRERPSTSSGRTGLVANALRQAQGERGGSRTPFDKLRANGAGRERPSTSSGRTGLVANALRQAQGERGWSRTPFDKLRANAAVDQGERGGGQASRFLARMVRCFSICHSRSLMVSRLSCSFLPSASPSSTLARLCFQYSAVGTSV